MEKNGYREYGHRKNAILISCLCGIMFLLSMRSFRGGTSSVILQCFEVLVFALLAIYLFSMTVRVYPDRFAFSRVIRWETAAVGELSGYAYTNRYFSDGIVLYRNGTKVGTILTARGTNMGQLCPEEEALRIIASLEAAGIRRVFSNGYSDSSQTPYGISCRSKTVDLSVLASGGGVLFLLVFITVLVLRMDGLFRLIFAAFFYAVLAGLIVFLVHLLQGFSMRTVLEQGFFSVRKPLGKTQTLRYADLRSAEVTNNTYSYRMRLHLLDGRVIRLTKGSAGYAELGFHLMQNRIPIEYTPDGCR